MLSYFGVAFASAVAMRGLLSVLRRSPGQFNRWLERSQLNQSLKGTPFSLSISEGFWPNLMIALGMVFFWTSVGHFIEVLAEARCVTENPSNVNEHLNYSVVLVLGFICLWLPKRSWISLGDFEPKLPAER